MAHSQSAASRVFAIPELLESILLFACQAYSKAPSEISKRRTRRYTVWEYGPSSPDDDPNGIDYDMSLLRLRADGMRWLLCKASRINYQFHSVISSSPVLQEALFFQWHGSQDCLPEFNPLLVTRFTWGYFHSLDFPKNNRMLRKGLLYENASWRRMFPLVPPVREAVVQESKFGMWNSQKRKHDGTERNGRLALEDLPLEDGLRMGMLFDIVEEWKQPDTRTRFRIGWVGGGVEPKLRLDEKHNFKPEQDLNVIEFADCSVQIVRGLYFGVHFALIPADTVNRVVIKLEDGTARFPKYSKYGSSYPKIESEGKHWSVNSIQWEESIEQ